MASSDFSLSVLPHQDDLLAYCRRLCSADADRAQDLRQEVLLRALKSWAEFEPEADPSQCTKGWLFRIATNTYIKKYHYERYRRETLKKCQRDYLDFVGGEESELFPVNEYFEGTAIGNGGVNEFEIGRRDPVSEELAEEIAAAISILDHDQREVIDRHYFRGQMYREIADDLDIPIGTVMSRLNRARTRLACLGQVRAYAASVGVGVGRVLKPDIVPSAQPAKTKSAKGPKAETRSVNRVMGGTDDSVSLAA